MTACSGAPADPAAEPTSTSTSASEDAAARFDAWLEAHARAQGEGVDGLYYAYSNVDTGPWFLSTMTSAEVLRFRLRRGDVARARATGDALLGWQHEGEGTHGERVLGAYPSELERREGGWAARYLYDTAGSLTVTEAMLDLFDATADARYLDAAKRTGAWIRDVMLHGERYGVWTEALPAPMQAVTATGDFDNRIPVGRVLFWLPTLGRLSRATSDPSYARVADAARAFLLKGQTQAGAFYDHYDPGYPAVPFDPSRFRAYASDGSVVADDSIRAALGALHLGDATAAASFSRWLVPQQQGGIYGYLELSNGQGHFPRPNAPYFDLVSSALYASLASAVGSEESASARQFVLSRQDADGGWRWGWLAETRAPVNADQSTLTGLWALSDMSPRSAP